MAIGKKRVPVFLAGLSKWFYLVHIFGSSGKRRWLVVVQEVAEVVDQEYQVSKYPSIKRKLLT